MSNIKKIVFIINQYSGTPEYGYAGRSYYFAKELAAKGYNVYLITASYTHLLKKQPVVNERFQIQTVDGFKLVWIKMPEYSEAHDKKRILNWFLFSYKITKLSKLLKTTPDTIVYSSPSIVGYLGSKRLAKQCQAKLILDIRDIWPLTLIKIGNISPSHPFIRLLSYIEKKAYLGSDIVVSNLKYAVNHMQSIGMNSSKFRWIPNGVDLDEMVNQEPLTKEFLNQLPKNKFIIGYTGTFGLSNDLNTLIAAAAIIQKADQNIAFVLIGSGRERQELLDKVSSLRLHNTHILNSIPKTQIQSALKLFDGLWIGAKSTDLYQFGVSPNKLFEYLYAGKPIIYSIDSGNFTPVTDYKCGVQVKPEDADDLANNILALKAMPIEARLIMGENGHNSAIKYFTYQSLTNKLQEIL